MLMPIQIPFDNKLYQLLDKQALQTITEKLGSLTYSAEFIIPNYRDKVVRQYRDLIQGNLELECQRAGMQLPFKHFGINIKFDKPVEVELYNHELNILPGLCQLIDLVGPVVIQNAYLQSNVRSFGHRNRFPHLQFHIDRSAKQQERHSMYTRDPFDDEQKHPRTSSTLFIPNIVAHLQSLKEGKSVRSDQKEIITSRLLFEHENMEDMIGNVVLEQRWDQPLGTGEICIIDNISVLHASYYRDAQRSGYKIGVRYLSGQAA